MDIVNKLKKELLKQAFTEEQKQTERLNECKHIASIYAQTENAIAVLSDMNLKSATTRLYDTEAKIICIVSKKGAQCIECHHKDI